MSKSVVLNLDRSMRLARDFWASLHSSAEQYWAPAIDPEKKVLSRFAQSLIYYNHEDLRESQNWFQICNLAGGIKPNNSAKTFDHLTLNALIDMGIKIPPDTTIVKEPFDHGLIEKALEIIRLAWPAAYLEMEAYVEGMVVTSDENVQSQTAPTWFGAVFLGHPMIMTRNIRAIATAILHEVGHLVLFAQSSLAPPLTNPNEEFYSEFKQTKRPSIMVLHAQIALARMILWLFSLRQYVDMNPNFEDTFPRAPLEKVLNRHVSTYLLGMQHIKQMPLTDSGLEILEDFIAIESLLRRG